MQKTPQPLFSQLLSSARVRHGFFTRCGGISTSVYTSLNCAYGSNDRSDHVRQNRAAVSAHLGLAADALVSLRQAHTNAVWTVARPWRGATPLGDGLVSKLPGIGLAVLGADCAPVLLADPDARVIGACHAGWKGALEGIVQNTVEAMLALGAQRKQILACIGPAIAQSSYEVGAEFHARFVLQTKSHQKFFVAGSAGKYHFDLPYFIEHQLREGAGVEVLERLPHDTCADEETFFSYRRAITRAEPDYGRQVSAITL